MFVASGFVFLFVYFIETGPHVAQVVLRHYDSEVILEILIPLPCAV